MYTTAQYENTRREIRTLRLENATLKRFHQFQKKKADDLEEVVKEQEKQIKELEREKTRLQEELEKTKQERDTYKEMVFKAGKKKETSHGKKKHGGQYGHKGYGRIIPTRIDHMIHAYLEKCPTCQTPLSRVKGIKTHAVVDLPHWREAKPITTQYEVERQWCKQCQKEVRATPVGVISGSRLGINLVTMVAVWRYRFREPFNKIGERLLTHYGLHISEGGLVRILRRTKEFLGDKYHEFLEEVRGSPVKHADETGWRMNGSNWWCWIFCSPKSTIYTIEESRGGGIPKRILQGSGGILVRDDYKGYHSVELSQQSCWAHPIRIVRDAAKREDASEEVLHLKDTLYMLFELLEEDIQKPFKKKERKQWYEWYRQDLQKIIDTQYEARDAQKIQTRIKNQNTNLLTALLYEGVPLTNNQAEQDLRTMVVTRKISGGSKSQIGAQTHAVNLSVIETIVKRNLPLLDTLQSFLLNGSVGKK